MMPPAINMNKQYKFHLGIEYEEVKKPNNPPPNYAWLNLGPNDYIDAVSATHVTVQRNKYAHLTLPAIVELVSNRVGDGEYTNDPEYHAFIANDLETDAYTDGDHDCGDQLEYFVAITEDWLSELENND